MKTRHTLSVAQPLLLAALVIASPLAEGAATCAASIQNYSFVGGETFSCYLQQAMTLQNVNAANGSSVTLAAPSVRLTPSFHAYAGSYVRLTTAATPPARLIHPTDLVYRGAFRFPDESSNGATWGFGANGMTFYPGGDPNGPADGYPGSLYSLGIRDIGDGTMPRLVSEFTIPAPVVSAARDIEELSRAVTLQPFADITGGRQLGTLETETLRDVQYYPKQGAQATDKLHWVMYEYYYPSNEIGFGWSELNLASPQAQGVWQLGTFPTPATNGYLFDIPKAWADTYTPGRYLAGGRNRMVNNGTWGPALYAFAPWESGNPPANGSVLGATELLFYPWPESGYLDAHKLRDYSQYDQWMDGAWLTAGSRSAVIFAGVKSLRRMDGIEYYGDFNVDGCGDKGYHAEPYVGQVLFYDPLLIAAGVRGQVGAEQIQPYAVFNPEDYLFHQGCRRHTLGGVGYDRANGLLYLVEQEVGEVSGEPIVHVFGFNATSQGADTTPPGTPGNLRVTANGATQVDLAWDAATDNKHLVGYVVYRFGEPIATTTATSYSDDKVNPGATYQYAVAAWDASGNLGSQAQVSTTTATGSDTRVPIISNIRYSGLSSTSITISWQTDEPATTHVAYGTGLPGNLTYHNATLVTSHVAPLTGLTPGGYYLVDRVTSADAGGRTNEFPIENWDFTTSGEGSTEDFAPVLNAIGSRRVYIGETIAFTVEAFDRDADDTLVYSSGALPSGASFNTGTRKFTWTPAAAGTFYTTFTVSDGDQTDSEAVAIIVDAP